MIRRNSSKYKMLSLWCLLMSINLQLYSQEKEPEFKPYTIESTYQKLKKHHPFITPIEQLVSDDIIANQDIVYKSIDDTNLKLDVYTPKDTLKTYPAVLLIHGGGWLTGSKENQRVMAQHLALNGFVAVAASYRLGLESPYPAAVHDLKDAIKWMRQNHKNYSIDTNKIAVLGASAGGQLATFVGVTPNSEVFGFDAGVSDDVQAIVNVDGIVSFIHPEAASEGKMSSIWLNGTKDENYKNWKEASPLEYINSSSPPILFINSSQPRFHAGRDDMIKLYDEHHIYNEIFTIEDSPHSFWLVHPWFDTTLNHTVNFLNKILNNSDTELKTKQ